MEEKTPESGPASLEVSLDPEVERGLYTNLAFIGHTDAEFVLDFAFPTPGVTKVKVLARLITSPSHVKRLAAALADNIAKYEARFGEIKVAQNSGLPEGRMN